MTHDEIRRMFPWASDAFIKANCAGPVAIAERTTCDDPLVPAPPEVTNPNRVHIRFISRRQRSCDPDNLSVKWLLDCLRYCGAIAGDEPEKITLEIQQEKVKLKSNECTIIDVFTTNHKTNKP